MRQCTGELCTRALRWETRLAVYPARSVNFKSQVYIISVVLYICIKAICSMITLDLVPTFAYKRYKNVLISVWFYNIYVTTGERATWPHISWIDIHLKVELTLDDSIRKLRILLRSLKMRQSKSDHHITRIQSFVPTRSRLNLVRNLNISNT